jgi:predicted nucleic acid-binding protein
VKSYVLDANALIRYFRRTPGSETVYDLFQGAKATQISLSISVVNLTEVIYVLSRYIRQQEAVRLVAATHPELEAMPVDEQVASDTAAIRIRYKLGLADCFAAELAMRLGATLVTADPEFAKLGKSLKLLTLPRRVG